MRADTVDVFWDSSVFLYRIKAPYDAVLKEEFKKAIPSQFRTWDPPTKTWVFEEDFLDPVLKIYNRFTQHVRRRAEVERENRAALPASTDTDTLAKSCTVFVGCLDEEILTKAFRWQAVKLHPDKGGDAKLFADFNSAFQFIMRGRK